MSKVLIIHHSLRVGGGEKLVYELAAFALKNNHQPYILIIDNYSPEYYDAIFEKMKVSVIRTRLAQISRLRHPKNIVKALFWKLRLKFFSSEFDSVHVVNLDTADKVKSLINHKRKCYWHIGNAIQFPSSKMYFSPELFENKNDVLVFINEYQLTEIAQQYGETNIKKIRFKLFLN